MTRAEKLLLALSDIRPDWVLDAAPKNTLPETGPRPRRSKVKYWGAAGTLAACLLLAFWGREALGGGTPPAAAPQTPPAAAASPAPTTAPTPAPENDALSNTQRPSGAALDELLGELGTAQDKQLLPGGGTAGAGMGYEARLAYTVDELADGNPGAGASGVEALPVWRDTSALPYGLPAVGLSEQAMTEALQAAAAALGVELTEATPHTLGETGSGLEHLDLPEGVGPDSVYSVEAAAENGWHLSISGDGTLTVSFKGEAGSEDSLPLPEGFAAPGPDTTDAEARALTAALAEQYAGLLGMEQPVAVSYAGDYDIYGERGRTYLAYEGSGNLGEQIVQYALRRTEFILDEEQALPGSTGGLWMLRRYDRLAAAELVGEYPLLLPEEARALLVAGYYTTGVPVDWPGEDCIEAVELTYRESGGLLMPFYRFWVRCDEAPRSEAEQALGLNTYGAFYVPAVRTEYWSALPEQEIVGGGALRKGAQ